MTRYRYNGLAAPATSAGKLPTSAQLPLRRVNPMAKRPRTILFGLVAPVFVLCASPEISVASPEGAPATYEGAPEENELIALHAALYAAYDDFYAKTEKITDPDKRNDFYDDNNPAAEFVPKLLEFEAQHRGAEVGLMALRRVVLLAAGSGTPSGPAYLGRREALDRLPLYADRPILTEILRYLENGAMDPAIEGLLRQLSEDPQADVAVREFSKLLLARWMLHCRDLQDIYARRVESLEGGAEEKWPTEKKDGQELLAQLAAIPELPSFESQAIELLQTIADSKEELRQPAPKGLDERWYLIRLDEERTKSMPLLTEIAAGLLFEQAHLKVGKPAPDLEVPLISEEDWSLPAQLGKVVIIQFSFKGCGPCEAMYPVLRKLQQSHGAEISILSIMTDEKKADAEEASTNGKVTWNIHWDGHRGPVATQWAVTGFPTVYVIDRKGRIAARDLRGEELVAEVDEL
jgi:thiol-disulfide isomerase/thioredoxin